MSQSISSIDIDYTLNGRSKLGAKRNRDAGRGEERKRYTAYWTRGRAGERFGEYLRKRNVFWSKTNKEACIRERRMRIMTKN